MNKDDKIIGNVKSHKDTVFPHCYQGYKLILLLGGLVDNMFPEF